MKRTLAVAILALIGATPAVADPLAREVRLGVDPTYPPLEYKTPDGKLAGFGIDIVEALCAEMKERCVWVESSWDGMIPGLLARKFDAIASSMMITEKRQAQIAFTDRVSNAPSRLVARADSGLAPNAQALHGKRVGVVQGSSQETYAKAEWRPAGVEVVSYQNQDLVYEDLASGRLDAALQGAIQASHGFLQTPRGRGFAFAGGALDAPEYFGVGDGIGLRKEDAELRQAFNRALAAILANGTYARINDRYFDFDIYGAH